MRDYYWITRDQLSSSISGSSLISPHIRSLVKKLIDHGSGSSLKRLITTEVKDKMSDGDYETLTSLLEKELTKEPNKREIHEVFIEMMAEKCTDIIEVYIRIIKNVDNSKIPFSLRQDLNLAEQKNSDIKKIYKKFNSDSQIYKALNNKE